MILSKIIQQGVQTGLFKHVGTAMLGSFKNAQDRNIALKNSSKYVILYCMAAAEIRLAARLDIYLCILNILF